MPLGHKLCDNNYILKKSMLINIAIKNNWTSNDKYHHHFFFLSSKPHPAFTTCTPPISFYILRERGENASPPRLSTEHEFQRWKLFRSRNGRWRYKITLGITILLIFQFMAVEDEIETFLVLWIVTWPCLGDSILR